MSVDTYDDTETPAPAGPCEHRRRVDQLYAGDVIFSPARRWETVTEVVQLPTYEVQIHTSHCRPGYSWALPGYHEVQALSRLDSDRPRRVVLIESATTILVSVSAATNRIASDHGERVLATAIQVRGKGWLLRDRPDGGELVEDWPSTKAAARSAMRRLARAHARGLGLEYADLGGAR